MVTSCHLKKVSATKWTNAWKHVQELAPEAAEAAQGAWREASDLQRKAEEEKERAAAAVAAETQRKEVADKAAAAAKEEEARRQEEEKAAVIG